MIDTIEVRLEVNGRRQSHMVEPRTSLADLLRGPCGLTGTHLGCEHGVCGACTVVVDDIPVRSCIVYAPQVDASSVTTIEGFDDDPLMGELRDAFTRHHALQCGFCTPGMLITARDIVMRFPHPDEARIREELGGNLCRCTGYVGIVNAIREVASRARTEAVTPVADAAISASSMPEAAPAITPPGETANTVVIAEQIAFAHPASEVWAMLADLERIARCLPGAELTAIDGDNVHGKLRIRFGPVSSAFDIAGVQGRDEAARHGYIKGNGQDTLTGSRARGRLDFSVIEGTSPGNCQLDVQLGFSLQGMLAQFSRGALVQDLSRQIIEQFGRNLSSMLAGSDAPIAATLSPVTMLWQAARNWVAGVFARKPRN